MASALRAAGAALLLCLAAVPAHATGTGSLSWLVGSWRGLGTMFGNASEATLEIRSALDGRFLEFTYRASGFEGRAFYRPLGEGRWHAQWFDNRGVTFPIDARVEAAADGLTLTSDWGSAASERGRTRYRRAEDGRLHVTDFVARPDGSWRAFAGHVLTRAQ